MILLVDVGNSNICFGISDKINIIQTYRFKTFLDKTSDEYYLLFKEMLSEYHIDDIIISSVVPIVTSALIKLFKKFLNIEAKVVAPKLKTGIKVKVDDPKTVGSDMICDCVGALKYSSTALIIDLGTATKYIYMKDNTFMGCSISPGISISMKALANEAALLPNIELIKPEKVISTNTINCMQSGLIYGAHAQIDGMIELIKKEIKNNDIKIIATGGLSSLIIPMSKHQIILDANLTLLGLQEIYKKNLGD